MFEVAIITRLVERKLDDNRQVLLSNAVKRLVEERYEGVKDDPVYTDLSDLQAQVAR